MVMLTLTTNFEPPFLTSLSINGRLLDVESSKSGAIIIS
jgi:hypothetical protein